MKQIEELKAKAWKDKALSQIKQAVKDMKKGIYAF